jgi:hypothetical protein
MHDGLGFDERWLTTACVAVAVWSHFANVTLLLSRHRAWSSIIAAS